MLLAAPLGSCSCAVLPLLRAAGLATAFRRLIELLAGIPSVVYGFWGLMVLVPLISRSSRRARACSRASWCWR